MRRAFLILLAVAIFSVYLITNQLNAGRPAITLDLPLDHVIPFIPAGVIVYLSVYAFLVMPALQIRSIAVFQRALLGFAVFNLSAAAVFTLMPVKMLRPEVVVDSLFTWGVAFNYALDPPYNNFPSLHVANAFFAAFLARRLDRPVGNVSLVIAAAIALSTLVTKQHWIADVAVGIPLGYAGYRFFVRDHIPRDATREELTFPRWYLGVLAASYGAILLGFSMAYFFGWKPF